MSKQLDDAKRELDFAIELHKKMDQINTALVQDKEIMEELTKQVHNLNAEIVPALKKFVMNMQETRMLVSREVEHILNGARQLKALAASNHDIGKFIDAILSLDKVMQGERINKLVSYISVAVNTTPNDVEKK